MSSWSGRRTVAITYTNNDYGKGLADSFAAAFEEMGGTVTHHRSPRGRPATTRPKSARWRCRRRRARRARLCRPGRPGIIQAALDTGAFDTFYLARRHGRRQRSSRLRLRHRRVLRPTPAPTAGASTYADMAEGGRLRRHLALLCRKLRRGGADPAGHAGGRLHRSGGLAEGKGHGRRQRTGQPILPGELAKALEMIANGGDIDYVGASAVELIGPGESAGNYREFEIKDGKIETVQVPLIA
jgi:branched-chain amino acid transport system substrate-binding protein